MLLVLMGGCGKEPAPVPGPGCIPQAVADSGGDVYFWPDPAESKHAMIGTPAVPGMTYEWSPSEGLSDPKIAQPVVDAPVGTILYTLTVKSACNQVVSHMRAVMLKEAPRPIGTMRSQDSGGEFHDYFTGYRPSFREHYRKQYLHMGSLKGVDPIPLELNYTPPGFKVNSQACGDCWAQGLRSSFQAILYFFDKLTVEIGVQPIIDCSGYGSCSGGNIPANYYKSPRGVIYEMDYAYRGRDGRCQSAPYHEQAQDSYIVTNASGGRAKWPDYQRALMTYGAAEVCGASSALGNGGWVSRNGGGGTDHCYGLFGWLDGAKNGKTAGSYAIIQNSWATKWGINGQGFYKLTSDGETLNGNVITENTFFAYKPMCPPPVVDGGPDRTIKQIPGTPQVVRVGTPGKSDQTYLWSPADGVDDISLAQPLVSPKKTTQYTVTSKNKCGEAHAVVTVHVYRDALRGKVLEVN